MTLEQQVSNLELSKKLKELGVEQEGSFFAWWERYRNTPLLTYKQFKQTPLYKRTSAFTVAELGEMLPLFIDGEWYSAPVNKGKGTKRYKLYFAKNEHDEYFVEYQEWSLRTQDAYELLIQRSADTEADARATMLIYLLENKLITLP